MNILIQYAFWYCTCWHWDEWKVSYVDGQVQATLTSINVIPKKKFQKGGEFFDKARHKWSLTLHISRDLVSSGHLLRRWWVPRPVCHLSSLNQTRPLQDLAMLSLILQTSSNQLWCLGRDFNECNVAATSSEAIMNTATTDWMLISQLS